MTKYITAILIMASIALCAQENTDEKTKKWSAARPDGHAPISVMGDHMHGKGEWMFSYRYMHMNMKNLKQGRDDASFDDALADYMVTPTQMPMNMHMLGGMFAPSDRLTLMVMFNYLTMSMDHITRTRGTFTTETAGFGDASLSGMYKLMDKNRQLVHTRFGLSIPTGSISEEDVTPASTPNDVELPYPMQIGSGTFDTQLVVTYLFQSAIFSYGAQVSSVLRFGENHREYRLGNRYALNQWIGLKLGHSFSIGATLEGVWIGEINGVDPDLNPMMVITADTNNSGRNILNGGIGFNYYITTGALQNLRFGFEFGYPLHQDLNGIQLKNQETLTLGLQYAL